MNLSDIADETVAHFLTDFPCDQALCKTEDYIRKFLVRHYAPDRADETISRHYRKIVEVLIDEYDHRSGTHGLLRFKFADNEGERVQGIGKLWEREHRIVQDALNELTDQEFEALSARLLAILGCDRVWKTPASHDQGLDSFGYSYVFRSSIPREIRSQCRVVFLAQAKHYNKHKIGSRDLREFVGSKELAVHKIFSTVDEKYTDLSIKPFGPTVLVFITTQEIPRTVKLMGKHAGILVFSAQDLSIMLSKAGVINLRSNRTSKNLARAIRASLQEIPCAQ